jgi:hypothetical protein
MLPEREKRQEQLSILNKLRRKGMPTKSEEMDSMFASVDENGKVSVPEEEQEPTVGEVGEVSTEEVGAATKKKKPPFTMNPAGSKSLKKVFGR